MHDIPLSLLFAFLLKCNMIALFIVTQIRFTIILPFGREKSDLFIIDI